MTQNSDLGTNRGLALLPVARSLSWGVVGLMVIASVFPLVRPDLYRMWRARLRVLTTTAQPDERTP